MPTPWIALSPLLALSVNFIVQIITLRTAYVRLFPSVIIGAVVGECCFLMLDSLGSLSPNPWSYFLLGQTAYLGAAFCYFAFVNLNATSLRIRILEELRAAGGHAPISVIMHNYSSKDVIRARLDRMLRTGLLVEHDGFYYIGKQYPLWVARFMDMLRAFLLK